MLKKQCYGKLATTTSCADSKPDTSVFGATAVKALSQRFTSENNQIEIFIISLKPRNSTGPQQLKFRIFGIQAFIPCKLGYLTSLNGFLITRCERLSPPLKAGEFNLTFSDKTLVSITVLTP